MRAPDIEIVNGYKVLSYGNYIRVSPDIGLRADVDFETQEWTVVCDREEFTFDNSDQAHDMIDRILTGHVGDRHKKRLAK